MHVLPCVLCAWPMDGQWIFFGIANTVMVPRRTPAGEPSNPVILERKTVCASRPERVWCAVLRRPFCDIFSKLVHIWFWNINSMTVLSRTHVHKLVLGLFAAIWAPSNVSGSSNSKKSIKPCQNGLPAYVYPNSCALQGEDYVFVPMHKTGSSYISAVCACLALFRKKELIKWFTFRIQLKCQCASDHIMFVLGMKLFVVWIMCFGNRCWRSTMVVSPASAILWTTVTWKLLIDMIRRFGSLNNEIPVLQRKFMLLQLEPTSAE